MEEQIIQAQSSPLEYFHILPNLADEELDPYQYRVLGHYLRVCGAQNKPCYESVRTTAQKCKMSHAMVIETRRQLTELGYLKLHKVEINHQKRVLITLLDFWPRNIAHFASLAKRPRQPSFAELVEAQLQGEAVEGGYGVTTPGYGVTTPGHRATRGGSLVEHKNNQHQEKPSKKNQKEEHHQAALELPANDDDDEIISLIFGEDEYQTELSVEDTQTLAGELMVGMGWLGAQTYLENLPKRQLKPLLEWLWFWDCLYGSQADWQAANSVKANPFAQVQNPVGKIIRQMALNNPIRLTEQMQFELKRMFTPKPGAPEVAPQTEVAAVVVVESAAADPGEEDEPNPSQRQDAGHREPSAAGAQETKANQVRPGAALWDSVLQELAQQLPTATYNSWVRDTWIVEAGGDRFTIGVRNARAIDWLQNRLSHQIRRILRCMLARPVQVQFKVAAALDRQSTNQPFAPAWRYQVNTG